MLKKDLGWAKSKGTKFNVTKSEKQREAEETNVKQCHTESHRVTQSHTESHRGTQRHTELHRVTTTAP